jgi:hypothetical protein
MIYEFVVYNLTVALVASAWIVYTQELLDKEPGYGDRTIKHRDGVSYLVDHGQFPYDEPDHWGNKDNNNANNLLYVTHEQNNNFKGDNRSNLGHEHSREAIRKGRRIRQDGVPSVKGLVPELTLQV